MGEYLRSERGIRRRRRKKESRVDSFVFLKVEGRGSRTVGGRVEGGVGGGRGIMIKD